MHHQTVFLVVCFEFCPFFKICVWVLCFSKINYLNCVKSEIVINNNMTAINDEDPIVCRVRAALKGLNGRVEEITTEQKKKLEEFKKLNELESKLEQERRTNEELRLKLVKVKKGSCDVDKVCALLQSRLTVGDSDQKRLQLAKNMFQISKELTGVRWDFNAPEGVVKGFVKNKSRRVLRAFELPSPSAATTLALWDALNADYEEHTDKENRSTN